VPEGEDWKKIAEGTTIGVRKFLRLPEIESDKIKLVIEESYACPVLSTFEVYQASMEPESN
jgi:alpha-L-fucosidase